MPGEIPQLVERAENHRKGARDRHGGEPRLLAGELSLDAAAQHVDTDRLKTMPPFESRNMLDDGNFGGRSQRPDQEMLSIWNVAVAETREIMETW